MKKIKILADLFRGKRLFYVPLNNYESVVFHNLLSGRRAHCWAFREFPKNKS